MVVEPCLIVDEQIAFGFLHNVVAMVINVSNWRPAVADRLYDESTALTHANPDTLVHMLGPTPSPVVRKRMADRQRELDNRYPTDEDRRVAVITDSATTRGAVTALGWITGGHMRGFASARIGDGATWLRSDAAQANDIVQTYHACERLVRRAAAANARDTRPR
ncbi:MAG: STAS/SEC14 domain-containing protein [Myxococcota bacterium]